MRIFLLIWLGQLVSLIGSDLTSFALGVWAYQTTGSVTQFALISLCIYLPNIIISPVAGALVDRWNRRWAMILSDTVTGLGTLVVLGLIIFDRLEIWHIYVAVGISSIFNAFHWPAYAAATTQLVPKQHLNRANSLVQIAKAMAKIISPTVAGLLIRYIQIDGILVIDFLTFLFGLVTLLSVRFPQLKSQSVQKVNLAQLWQETVSGWNYIVHRPGLRVLLNFSAITYFTLGILQVVFWPLILNFGSSEELGLILSISGCGMLLGSLFMSFWGGPKRRVYVILTFVALQGMLLCLGGLQASIKLAALGAFGYLFAYPIIVSCNQTIWQRKVPLELQGRVFAGQQMVERSLSIFAYLVAGPLVDQILEPMLAPGGLLADSIGQVIGVGPGRGIGFLFILIGILNIVATLFAYQEPRLRRLEDELPDAIGDEPDSKSQGQYQQNAFS